MTDKHEPQKPGVWNCTFEHIRDIGVVVTSEASKPETQAQGRMCSCIECVPDQPEPQAQAANEHAEQSEREKLIEWLLKKAYAHGVRNDDESLKFKQAAALLAADKPVDMVLYCPKCGLQHIDAPDKRTPDWTNPPHKSHLCHDCGHIWRPSDTPTNGVERTASSKDADTAPVLAAYKAGGEPDLNDDHEFWISVCEGLDAANKSATHGMNLGQRIAHVGGRVTEKETVEFGSVMAVKALVDHILRDTRHQPQPVPDDVVKDAERYRALRDKGHGNTSRRPMAWIATGSLRDGVSWVNGEKADIAVDAMLKEVK